MDDVTVTKPKSTSGKKFDVDVIKEQFPAIKQFVYNKPLIYLDNAATTQKPMMVIDAIDNYYATTNSNVHRGLHFLSEKATAAFEQSRQDMSEFIGAASAKEIIFVRGTTEAINLVASSYGRHNIQKGDEIILTHMEHHSNIIPWQLLCDEVGCKIHVIPINDSGELILDELDKMISAKTKMLAVTHVSNALGTVNPIKEIIELAHRSNVPVMIDGAQAVQHLKIDVQDLDCDFYAFSGHKMYGPTGIGILYGKAELLEAMQPYQGGGEMIKTVSFEKTTYNVIPHKFEAGTPNIAGVIGLAKAIEFIRDLGLDAIAAHEQELLEYAHNLLSEIDDLTIIGEAANKTSVVSFVLKNIHPHDVGTIVDREGIAIRSGHHCCQPLMERFNVPATSRASFAVYNTKDEIDILAESIQKVIKLFHG